MEASRIDTYPAPLQRVIPNHDMAMRRYLTLTADSYFGKIKFVDGFKDRQSLLYGNCAVNWPGF